MSKKTKKQKPTNQILNEKEAKTNKNQKKQNNNNNKILGLSISTKIARPPLVPWEREYETLQWQGHIHRVEVQRVELGRFLAV